MAGEVKGGIDEEPGAGEGLEGGEDVGLEAAGDGAGGCGEAGEDEADEGDDAGADEDAEKAGVLGRCGWHCADGIDMRDGLSYENPHEWGCVWQSI